MKRLFFFDFDGTITKCDTNHMMVQNYASQSEIWKTMSDDFFKKYDSVICNGELADEELLKELDKIEEYGFDLIEKLDVLKGAMINDIYPLSKEVEFRDGFGEFCAQQIDHPEIETEVHIVSANWFYDLIHYCLEDYILNLKQVKDSYPFEEEVRENDNFIFCNTFEEIDGKMTGRFIRRCVTSKDKEEYVRSVLRSCSSSCDCFESVYVGDALMDVPPLKLCDQQFVIGGNERVEEYVCSQSECIHKIHFVDNWFEILDILYFHDFMRVIC